MVSLVVLDLCYLLSYSIYSQPSSFSQSGFSGGGGGSGGSISLSACTIDAGPSSLVQANGGAGGKSLGTHSVDCGGGGGGGGVIEMTSANNVLGTLVLQVFGGDPPSGGNRPGVAGSAGKVFLVSAQTVILLILDCLCQNSHPIFITL